MTFYEFMESKYSNKNNSRGDLFFDMKRDINFPKNAITKDKIIEHLLALGASNECMGIFKKCWKSYALHYSKLDECEKFMSF